MIFDSSSSSDLWVLRCANRVPENRGEEALGHPQVVRPAVDHLQHSSHSKPEWFCATPGDFEIDAPNAVYVGSVGRTSARPSIMESLHLAGIRSACKTSAASWR